MKQGSKLKSESSNYCDEFHDDVLIIDPNPTSVKKIISQIKDKSLAKGITLNPFGYSEINENFDKLIPAQTGAGLSLNKGHKHSSLKELGTTSSKFLNKN